VLAAGVVLGTVVAWAVGRVIATQLYDLPAHDPISTAVGILLVCLAAAAAAFLPARRASRVDPAMTLRQE
jgi:ABC-type lipoprotein release transport system permease subunit